MHPLGQLLTDFACPARDFFLSLELETTNLPVPAVPCSLLLRCLRKINFPGRTMVLSRAKEEGAGAKENRSKGEGIRGTPHPPTLKPLFMRGGNQVKLNKINSLINRLCLLISKLKPRKIAFFDQKQPFLPVLSGKRPRLEQF